MNTEELLQKMKNFETEGRSSLMMRSENAQEKQRSYRIPRIKKLLKKKAKYLIPTDIAIPFNPATGEEDDKFNPDVKFRPPYSAETVAKMCKRFAADCEKTKEKFMRGTDVQDWDLSDPDVITEDDIKIFSKYKVARIFSIPVVSVNIPVVTKSQYAANYSIDVATDPMTGEIVGEVPGVLKINKLFRDKCYEEVQAFDKKIESGELKLDETQQKDQRRSIYSKNPVSDVHPANFITAIELPLTNSYDVSSDFKAAEVTADELKSRVILSPYNKGFKGAVTMYLDGSWKKYDKSLNYFEVDMSCPTEGDENTDQGKQRIGLDTKYEKPTELLKDQIGDDYEKFNAALIDYLDGEADIETIVRRSTYIKPYTPELENQLFTALPTVLDPETDPYLTDDVIMANKEVYMLAFPTSGVERVDEIEAGVSDGKKGELNEEKAAAEAKEYSLDSEEFTVDTEEVSFEE